MTSEIRIRIPKDERVCNECEHYDVENAECVLKGIKELHYLTECCEDFELCWLLMEEEERK